METSLLGSSHVERSAGDKRRSSTKFCNLDFCNQWIVWTDIKNVEALGHNLDGLAALKQQVCSAQSESDLHARTRRSVGGTYDHDAPSVSMISMMMMMMMV